MSIQRFMVGAALVLGGCQAALAGEFATAQEAKAMLARAVAAIKANKKKALEEITVKDPKWIDRDLYPFALDMQGVVLAHGANAKLVGKALGELKDADGKAFVKDMIDQSRSTGKCVVDYKWTDPLSKKVLAKHAFCERIDDDMFVGVGVYAR
ncbi:cache domain-containing protein [Aquabacterium sp.]|uniref:cache domain-containing protein n=1 Tax=Aquabacterium sp. TaxID=1872578 RepID=UPI002BFAC300|nr:cache domain-containing protein [Aquabacterium sp.]HSW03985.1 cache domain-containing protein [Aquabacterium sp.]